VLHGTGHPVAASLTPSCARRYHIEDPTQRLAGRKKTLDYKGGMCHVKDAGEQAPHREATINTRANQVT
jgi:hypothetical protein